MRIGGLRRFSVIDYPGKVAAVIFTQGCNFRCPFCFNPELVLEEFFRSPIPEEEIFSFLERRKGQLEGVVVTGGEPTVQEDLPDFLRKIRRLGYLVKLDTNGSHPSTLKQIIDEGLVNYIAMDVKAPLKKYNLLAGVEIDTALIQESISVIIHSHIEHEFRTTAVKPLISPNDFQAIGDLVRNNQQYFIQAFIPKENILDKSLLGRECYTEDEIHRLQEQWGKKCQEGGQNADTKIKKIFG